MRPGKMAMRSKLLAGAAVLALCSSAALSQATRVEEDLLGQKEIPASALYGVQTARAMENFQI